MQSSPTSTNGTRTKQYAVTMLLVTILAAVAQLLVLPPTWLTFWASNPSIQNPVGPTSAEAQPTVSSPPSHAVATLPSGRDALTSKLVCAEWLSESSGRRYNFICQDQTSFDIYENRGGLLTKVGSGRLVEDGSLEADIRVAEKDRLAHLRLRLSSDGQKIEGSFHGDDPRESGHLVFHRG